MENRLIENQKSSQNEFNRFNRATSVVSRKNAFLGASVGWFSYSTFVAFISAIVMLVFFSHALVFMKQNIFLALGLSFLLIIFIFVEFIVGPRMSFWTQLVIITLSMVLFGIVVLSFAIVELLETFAKGAQNINLPLAQTFGVIIAPIVIMAIMAILACFDLIKIKIAYALTIFIFISFLFIWIISSFIFSSWLYSLIPAFGFALMVCYMAIDWWLISRYNKAFNATVSNEATKKEFMKLTIYFGFKLAYDYLWALIYLVKLIRLAKN